MTNEQLCLIVEDHPLTAAGMGASIAEAFPLDVQIVHTVIQAVAFLKTCLPTTEGVVLVDMRLKDGTGLDVLKIMRDRGLTLRGIVVSGASTARDIASAKSLGARGFIPKSAACDFVLQAVKIALIGGECFLPPDADTLDTDEESTFRNVVAHLTPSQRRILDCIVSGAANKEIAARIGCTNGHVRNVAQDIYRKFGVTTRSQLIVEAHADGYRPKP